jgi:ATP-dependent Lhr-like helicase
MGGFDRLSPALQYQVVHTLGFTSLRPVQTMTIDAVLDGKHCVVLAPTAGGKTEAAFFPLLSAMNDQDWRPVSVLYLSPILALLTASRTEAIASLPSPRRGHELLARDIIQAGEVIVLDRSLTLT